MNKNAVTERLIQFEGSIPYMYRCTGGEATVGVGHAIQTADDAAKLTWTKPATVAADYARVAAAPVGNVASYYVSLSTCRMSDAEITRLCGLDIDSFEVQLKQALPQWDTYPEPAQEALFDMGFNLGVAGLMKFTNMLAAVDRGDWPAAANESHRKGIPENRNQEIADLFLMAGNNYAKNIQSTI
jgi:GH24 family phage-related lysozyme (muramidase)